MKRRSKRGEENRIRVIQQRQQKMRCSMVEWVAAHESLRGNEIKEEVKQKPPHADHNLHPASLFVWLKTLLNATNSKAGRSGV